MAMRMPFGKYKGMLLRDIPSDYLVWVLGNVTRLNYYLRFEIETLLQSRDYQAQADEDHHGCELSTADSVIREWWRGLVRDYHPDRGGSVEVMQALNEAHSRLKQMVGV
jgi:hypothetical protein